MRTSVFITSFNARLKRISNPSIDDMVSVTTDLIKPIKYLSYDDKIKLVVATIK